MKSLYLLIKESGLTKLEFLQGLNNLCGQQFQEKVEPLLEDIICYQSSSGINYSQNPDDEKINQLCRKIARRINPRLLINHLELFIRQDDSLCRELAMKIPEKNLIPHFKYLVDRHLHVGYNPNTGIEGGDSTLYHDLAIKIPIQCIEDHFKWLLEKQSNEAKTKCFGDTLYKELLLKTGADIIITNLDYILDIASKCGPILCSDTQDIVRKLLSKIPEEELVKRLKYFVKKSAYRKHQTINWLNGPEKWSVGLTESINKKSAWFDQIICCELALKIHPGYLATELKYLIACQKAQSIHLKFTRLSNFCKELAMSIDERQLIGYLEYLIDCQKSDNEHVAKLCEELALKISKKLLISKKGVILKNISSDNDKVKRLCEKLALKIEDPKRMGEIFQRVLNVLN